MENPRRLIYDLDLAELEQVFWLPMNQFTGQNKSGRVSTNNYGISPRSSPIFQKRCANGWT
ncbi:MAG: hypothetical protein C0396_08815, partial [Anaerolinea sp.]|nr:hypothetical protein [Anaerolinea sp.]